ncbi:MAG: FmdE family protein [Bacteroidota bacterium]
MNNTDFYVNPREEIELLIRENNLKKLLIMSAQIHGHFCHGIALGVYAAVRGMNYINESADGLEDLISIVETNNCFSDGIQFVTGCTFGNNSLIFKDFGKLALTISLRNGKGIRISELNTSKEKIRSTFPGFSEEFKKLVSEKNHSEKAKEDFKKAGYKAALNILSLDFDNLFKIEEVVIKLPPYAPSHKSIICDICNENTMSTRIVSKGNKKLCIACSGESHFQLDGYGISKNKSSKT